MSAGQSSNNYSTLCLCGAVILSKGPLKTAILVPHNIPMRKNGPLFLDWVNWDIEKLRYIERLSNTVGLPALASCLPLTSVHELSPVLEFILEFKTCIWIDLYLDVLQALQTPKVQNSSFSPQPPLSFQVFANHAVVWDGPSESPLAFSLCFSLTSV